MKRLRFPRLIAIHLTLWTLVLPLVVGIATRGMTRAQARELEAVEVRSLLTAEWGVARPTGLAYSPDEGSLLVAGAAGRETEVLRLSPRGASLGTVRLPEISSTVTLAFDRARKRLAALDGSELVSVPAGELRSARPHVGRMGVPNVGLQSPAGATFDPATGTWFILDDGPKAIVRVPMPGGSPGTPSRISLQGLGAVSLQGLAFNSADGLFYSASPEQNLLYGTDAAGVVQKTYGLGAIELGGPGLRDLRALAFAPSSDPTDDPATQHLFIADAGGPSTLGGVAEVSLAAEATAAAIEQGTLVQTIQTSQFNPPSPDPSGITYFPQTDHLMISDSEVDEMSIFRGVNLWQVTRTGTVTDTGVTTAFSPSTEPTGLGFNPADRTLFVSDDGRRRVFLVRPGADGRYGTPDDQPAGLIDVSTFPQAVDAEGVEFDTNSGDVFIVDGVGREVWRVDPGANASFGDGDDVVSHFDVGQFGALDPEGIGSVTARNNLVIVDDPSESVYEVTKSGALVQTVDLSNVPGIRKLAGVTLAPATNSGSTLNLWIADRGVDNDSNPSENDGKVFEISWPSAPPTSGQPQCSDAVDNDSDGLTDFPADPGCTDAQDNDETDQGPSLDRPIAAGTDDAEEKPNGTVARGQAALELVRVSSGNQTVGLRFTGIAVPSGATVVNAYVQFQARRATSVATNLTIQGQASDNAATFSTAAFNISSRSRTTASAQWSPPPWTVVGERGANQRTSDLSAVLQEIINRPGWASGNALALIITGSGKRIAEAFEGARAPVLHMEFTAP